MWNELAGRGDLGALAYFDNLMMGAHARRKNYLPDLSGSPALFAASDFTGEQKASPFSCFSFVITTADELHRWDNWRRHLRRSHGLGNRRISYSKLKDSRKNAALRPFLFAANELMGLAVTILVEKQIESLFIKAGRMRPGDVEVAGMSFAHWKPIVFERMMRATHFLALFVAGLSTQGQNIVWITDEDDIAPNTKRLRELTHAFGQVLGNLLPHSVGHIRVGTTGTTAGDDLVMEDFAAIPDLMGGAVNEIVAAYDHAGISLSRTVLTPPPEHLPRKAQDLLEAFVDDAARLRKLVFTVRQAEGSTQLLFSQIMFHSQARLVRA